MVFQSHTLKPNTPNLELGFLSTVAVDHQTSFIITIHQALLHPKVKASDAIGKLCDLKRLASLRFTQVGVQGLGYA